MKEVAAKAGITSDTLRNWELGRCQPGTPGDLKKVADVLEVKMEYLLGPVPKHADLAYKLLYYRRCKGWTQKQMAWQMGVSDDYLGDAENGKYIEYIHRKASELEPEFFKAD